MNHSTPKNFHPRKESLNFLKIFARLYSPAENNEFEARKMARALALAPEARC